MANTEYFYFPDSMGKFSNTVTLVDNEGFGLKCLTVEEGFSKMVNGVEKSIMIDFSEFNQQRDKNLKSMRELALGILKITDGKHFNAKATDQLMSQIKVRVSINKTLREYLSSVELCYVTFNDGTSCLIGDPVREQLTTTDTHHLEFQLPNIQDHMCYPLEGMGIHTSIVKYFKAKNDKVVDKSYIINSVTAFEAFKEIFNED